MGCHFLLQGDLPDPGIKPRSPALQALFTDWAMRETPRHLISCFLYIIPTPLHSNLMNDIVNSILHMRNKGSEILTTSSGWAEISSNSNAQAAFLGHVPFKESFFFPFGKKIYLEQKREKVNQFIMTLEGGQSYHSPKLKRIKKCSNKLLLVKYIREIIRVTSWFCLNNMNAKHINVYHSPFFIRGLQGRTF